MMLKALLAMIVALGLFGSVQAAQSTYEPMPHCFPCE
jgi:hypothetical protein